MIWRFGRGPRLLAATVVIFACSGDSSGPNNNNNGGNTPAAIASQSGTGQTGMVGAALAQPLVVKVTNSTGGAVARAVVTFRVGSGNGSVTPAVDTTDASGLAQASFRLGTSTAEEQRVDAQTVGLGAVVAFTATSQPGPAATLEKLTEVGCAIPGGSGARDVVVRVTDSFGNPVPAARVDWNATGSGNAAPTSSTTGADGRATTRWSAGSEAGQSLTASVSGLTAAVFTAQLATSRTIAQGQTLTLTGDASRCNDVAAGGARYLVAITNTTGDANSSSSFSVSGGLAGSGSTVDEPVVARYDFTPAASMRAVTPEALEARRAETAHQRVLDGSMNVVRQMQALPAASNRILAQQSVAAEPPPNVGDTLSIKVPNALALSCALTSLKGEIRARVVYVGTRGVVLEDVAAPLAGTMDDLYRQVGQEFDTVMWPILTTNFGNPLAYDAQTDNNQRMFMVFTTQVNNQEGLAGFVVSTDFYSPTGTPACPISNKREIFYARAPVSTATGNQTFRELTKENWYRQTRTVVIHEGKHLVAFADRFARSGNGFPSNNAFEHKWLEESTAMMAEELWARTVFGYAQRGNVTYRNSVHCEVRPQGFPECGPVTMPRSMFDHFLLLHDYEVDIEKLSPLGQVGSDDFTWYGSGWAFLRWAIDQASGSESAFLTDITQEPVSRGIDNMVARTGRSFADLITDFTLSLALDDRAGFTAPRPQLTMPSWNVPDIFLGLSTDFPASSGGFFATPMVQHTVTFGSFNVNIDRLQGGSMAVFELSGAQAGRQLLEFKGAVGGALPPALRVTIVRLQ